MRRNVLTFPLSIAFPVQLVLELGLVLCDWREYFFVHLRFALIDLWAYRDLTDP